MIQESLIEHQLSELVDRTSNLHSKLAPDSFQNMALFGQTGCRIGETKVNE